MPKYSFLSDKWIREAKKIRDEFAPGVPDAPPMTMNLIVTEVPAGSTSAADGTMFAHLDSTNGQLDLEEGHLEQAEVTVSADYATVKALLVDQDPAAAMSAFLSGKIRVQGDLAKLLALQSISPDPEARATAELVAGRIKAITLD